MHKRCSGPTLRKKRRLRRMLDRAMATERDLAREWKCPTDLWDFEWWNELARYEDEIEHEYARMVYEVNCLDSSS